MTGAAFAASVIAEADRQNSWWPWLAGFIPGLLVIWAAYGILKWMRSRR